MPSKHVSSDVRRVALASARIVIPVAYAVAYYACAIWLPTTVAAVVLGLVVLGMCAWLYACLRMEDDRRASHLAQQAFVAKVAVLPLEVVVVVVYAGVFGYYSTSTWLLSVLAMYLGMLGGSIFVVGAARAAHAEGRLPLAWKRAFAIAAFVPACDALAAMFLWFALLRKRLLEM